MGVLKRCLLGVLAIGFTLLAMGDTESAENHESKQKEATSKVTQTPKGDVEDTKVGKPTVRRGAEQKEEPLEPLVLNEKIESAANIALPQDI